MTNDDGIHAPGLRAIAETLAVDFDVFVVAPDEERSATSHCINISREGMQVGTGFEIAWRYG